MQYLLFFYNLQLFNHVYKYFSTFPSTNVTQIPPPHHLHTIHLIAIRSYPAAIIYMAHTMQYNNINAIIEIKYLYCNWNETVRNVRPLKLAGMRIVWCVSGGVCWVGDNLKWNNRDLNKRFIVKFQMFLFIKLLVCIEIYNKIYGYTMTLLQNYKHE